MSEEKKGSSSDIEPEPGRETLTHIPFSAIEAADPLVYAAIPTDKLQKSAVIEREIIEKEALREQEITRRRQEKQRREETREAEDASRQKRDSAAAKLVKDAQRDAEQKQMSAITSKLAKVEGNIGLHSGTHHNAAEIEAAILENQIEELSEQMKREGLGLKKKTHKRRHNGMRHNGMRHNGKKSLKMRKTGKTGKKKSKKSKKANHHKKIHRTKSIRK